MIFIASIIGNIVGSAIFIAASFAIGWIRGYWLARRGRKEELFLYYWVPDNYRSDSGEILWYECRRKPGGGLLCGERHLRLVDCEAHSRILTKHGLKK